MSLAYNKKKRLLLKKQKKIIEKVSFASVMTVFKIYR